MLSHRALRARQRVVGRARDGARPRTTRCWPSLPLAHSFGLNGALLAPLLAGASRGAHGALRPRGGARAPSRATGSRCLPAVATMFRRLLDVARAGRRPTSRACASRCPGAAPCPWELAEAWRRRTGVRILRGYGMTELFRPISYLADDPRDLPDAIGRPVPGVEVRLVDEDGRACRPGEVGELWIRSPAAHRRLPRRARGDRARCSRTAGSRRAISPRISPEGFVTHRRAARRT